MKEKVLDLYEYAKKVDAFSPKKDVVEIVKQTQIKGMRLQSMELSKQRGRSDHLKSQSMKNAQKMDLGEFDTKKISFVRTAYSAYKCSRNQDLHLFQYQKIYVEKKSSLRGVVGWRLPKTTVVQERLKTLVDGLKFKTDSSKSHIVTWIVRINREAPDKALQEHLEIQKREKEKRNYFLTKPVF